MPSAWWKRASKTCGVGECAPRGVGECARRGGGECPPRGGGGAGGVPPPLRGGYSPECPPCGEGGEGSLSGGEGSISSILGVRVGDSS